MTVPTHQFEAKVRAATRRTNKSGDWWSVTLEIQPHDFDEALCTMAQAQQRVMAVLAAVDDEEKPVQVGRKPAETRSELARRLCGVREFQDYVKRQFFPGTSWETLGDRYECASHWVKNACRVHSKSELDPPNGNADWPPAQAWDRLFSEFQQATGRMAERH